MEDENIQQCEKLNAFSALQLRLHDTEAVSRVLALVKDISYTEEPRPSAPP